MTLDFSAMYDELEPPESVRLTSAHILNEVAVYGWGTTTAAWPVSSCRTPLLPSPFESIPAQEDTSGYGDSILDLPVIASTPIMFLIGFRERGDVASFKVRFDDGNEIHYPDIGFLRDELVECALNIDSQDGHLPMPWIESES